MNILKSITIFKVSILSISFFHTALIYAQNNNSDWCGFNKIIHSGTKLQKVTDSTYLESINQTGKLNKAELNKKIYQIPVVFHILYHEQNENIADSVINSQMDILNHAFYNYDSLNIRREFRSTKGNAKIQFVLAGIDPTGNATRGVKRIKTWRKTFEHGDSLLISENMKSDSKGGADAWDTDKYLNIWVCNLNSIQSGSAQVLGYAYPPVNAKYWNEVYYKEKGLQGIVIHYQVIGLNNPHKIKGSNTGVNTLVHEIGHYLGLKHIWAESSNCSEDDYLWDTPQASTPTRYCDYNKNSCTKEKPNDLPDMIENYMDYSPEKCLQMFTKQQVSLMQYNLMVNRGNLFEFVFVEQPYHSGNKNVIITLYPNPVKDYIYLEKILNSGTPNSRVKGEILDMLGNRVIAFDFETSIYKVDMASYSPGCYFIYFRFDHEIMVKRFIKQ